MEGSEALFEKAKPLLEGDLSHGVQAALAAEIGMKPDAFRMAIHRLRKRLRNGVKAEIQSTLDRDADVQEELESLFAALSR
jgi:RNA polymerase sigma-70 factor (ECF subfamily)